MLYPGELLKDIYLLYFLCWNMVVSFPEYGITNVDIEC